MLYIQSYNTRIQIIFCNYKFFTEKTLKETMKPIERLQQYIEYRGLSMNSFDSSIGTGNGYIGKQIKKKGSIGSDILEKIFSSYPELNPTWLLTGNGSMLLEENNTTTGTFNTKEKAAFEKILDGLSIDKIITYIHEHEKSRGFDKNAVYKMFLKIRTQRKVIEELEAMEARYKKQLSALKGKKKH